MKCITFNLNNAAATLHLGVLLGQFLNAGCVILLQGDLGSGKTTLVQGIGKGLGIDEQIVSPTFTLINEYTTGRLPLYHVDLYRLSAAEIAALNIETYWEGTEVDLGILAIEWAEKLDYKPPNYLELNLKHLANGKRQISFSSQGEFMIDSLRSNFVSTATINIDNKTEYSNY